MSTPTKTAPTKANDDVLLRLLAVGQRWKARGEGAEYCSIISLDAGTDYPVQFQWERDKILGRDTAAGFLDNNEPAEASASEFIRVALATLQAENVRLRGGLKREVPGNAIEWDDTPWVPELMLEQREALRRKFEEVSAEVATLRERLEAAERALERPENWPIQALQESNALHARATAAEGERDELAFKAESLGKLDVLRAEGWSVAVHNDYRLKGRSLTFWLFTRSDGRWIKGEGATDAEAIAVAWASFYQMARPDDAREDSADNHRGEEGYER